MNRKQFVVELDKAVNSRVSDGEKPENNFRRVANRWNAFLTNREPGPLNDLDVALMMIDLKLARIESGYSVDDSLIDVAGYAACAADLLNDKRKEGQ